MSRYKNCDDDINKKISTSRGIILMKGIDDMKPITHKNCLGVRGIKVFKCIKCGCESQNYMNGIDVCKKCCEENNICQICGKDIDNAKLEMCNKCYNYKSDLNENGVCKECDLKAKKKSMYAVVFTNWNGQKCEIIFGEEEAKKRYRELDDIYLEVHLLKIEKEIIM